VRVRTLTAVVALTGALALSGVTALSAVGSANAPTTAASTPSEVEPQGPSAEASDTANTPKASPSARTVTKAKPVADRRKVATLTVTSSASGTARVTLVATSNAKSVQVRYRTGGNSKRIATHKVRKGKVELTLDPWSKSIRVRAKGTKKLVASPWVKVSPAEPQPSPGTTYTVSSSSRILGSLAGYKSVNKYTRDYYMIRSYMQRFEAQGGGTLVLAPGRYEISSTIYVPSNTKIRLSAGTTLVKLNKTGTKKFKASDSMFMLIERKLGKKKRAVGGHNGASDITITGAGGGRSVIDMADVRDSLAIISGHNRGVSITGITFRNMNNNHFIEMDGCADCTIAGNEFLDAARGTRQTAEAINLDTPDPKTHGFGSIWSKQDGTPNERVTISANRFQGLQRAVGTHNFTAGAYHRDITFTGNTITGNTNDAIHIMNWADPVFSGNTIASDSAGIRACGTINPTITGNTFSESARPVVFRTCTGEHGRTAANRVNDREASALGENLVGPGLGMRSVEVPSHGAVAFDGSGPGTAVPCQPLVESVVAGDQQVTVRWAPACADPRAPVTAYRIVARTDPAEDPVKTFDAPANATEAVITGLANGSAHHVTVAAVNGAGASPTGPWATATVTPLGPPSAPSAVAATSPFPGALRLEWAKPGTDGGRSITSYRAAIYRDAGADEPLPGSPVELHRATTSHEWLGLTEGSWYYLRVSAVNDLGEGAASGLVPVLVQFTPPGMLDPEGPPAPEGSSPGSPSTEAVPSEAPSAQAPSTQAPPSRSPSAAPSAQAPSAQAPSAQPPSAQAPSAQAPSSRSSSSRSPSNQSPSSSAP